MAKATIPSRSSERFAKAGAIAWSSITRLTTLIRFTCIRNSFSLTNVYGKATAGVLKDVVLVKGFKKMDVDVTPAMEGQTLFHCDQQLHMDYGFKLLFNVV